MNEGLAGLKRHDWVINKIIFIFAGTITLSINFFQKKKDLSLLNSNVYFYLNS